MNRTVFQGDLHVSDLIHEAAKNSLKIKDLPHSDDGLEPPFGTGRVLLQEVQPGLRCEASRITCTTDHMFEVFGDPLITCNIKLDGILEDIVIQDCGAVKIPLNQAVLIGLGEPTHWKRQIRAGQFFKSFGFTIQPTFFERFAKELENEQLAALNMYRTGRHATLLPPSQRLVELGNNAFGHPYIGSLEALYQESNTLLFVLEVVNLLREETRLVNDIGKKQYDRLMHARSLIDNNLITPPKTLDLAKQVGSNISTLQANFKLAFGMTIFGYVKTQRLEMARILIAEHNLGSAETGYRVGFSNPAAFTAAYRKHFGYPPSSTK